MIPQIFYEEKDVMDAVGYFPCVSIILPFEPKMAAKKDLEYRLQRAAGKVEKDLLSVYPGEKIKPVTDKLKQLINRLDFNTYKQSIAIFVSPVLEKVYYLDIPVEERIVINESFEIRDLVYCKKDIHKYLILVLGSGSSLIFLGNTTRFIRVAANTASHMPGFEHEPPERVANFSDPAQRKELLHNEFLHAVDNDLGHILRAYALPLFVMGTERTIGHFKKITHHSDHIAGFIKGNFDGAAEQDIHEAVAPYVADWKKVKQEHVLLRLDAAMGARKLVTGQHEVCKEAALKKGRLLVVEKNYMCPAQHGDIVDDAIENVLKNGGDVEFVDEGVLKNYDHIALELYYSKR